MENHYLINKECLYKDDHVATFEFQKVAQSCPFCIDVMLSFHNELFTK